MKKWALALLLMLYGCNQEEEKIVPVQETIKVQGIDIELISPENAAPIDIELYYEKSKENGFVLPKDFVEMVGLYYFNPEPSCYTKGSGRYSYKECYPGLIEKACSIESVNLLNSFLSQRSLDERERLARQQLVQLKEEIKSNTMPYMPLSILKEGEDFVIYSKSDFKPEIVAKLALKGLVFNVRCLDNSPTAYRTSHWEEEQIKTWVKTLLDLNRAKVENTQQ